MSQNFLAKGFTNIFCAAKDTTKEEGNTNSSPEHHGLNAIV